MENIFLKLLNMSITASWLVLVIILLRILLKKAPKFLRCVMWAMVGIRLLCPFSLQSALSLIPIGETVPQEILYSPKPQIHSGIPSFNSVVNPAITQVFTPDPLTSVNPLQIITFVISIIWIIGMGVMLLYAFLSYLRIHIKVREAIKFKDNIYMCDCISAPFILGVFCPRIYIPSTIHEADIEYIIAHENAHLKRRDNWWKPLGFILLSIYWFNPVIWVAYILFCRDIEFSCDEKVLKEKGIEIKKTYSNALINCSVPNRMVAAYPLAFSEVGVKRRIKAVLNYKKPAFGLVIVAIVCCVALSACFLTNPTKEETKSSVEIQNTYSGIDGIAISCISLDLSADNPYIKVMWKNDNDDEFAVGSTFNIDYLNKSGEYISCLKDKDLNFNALGYIIDAHGERTMTYEVAAFDLSKNGSYRMYLNSFQKGEFYIDFIIGTKTAVVSSPESELIEYDEKYYCMNPGDKFSTFYKASLYLNTKKQIFYMTLSPFSSYIPLGHYEYQENDEVLVLKTDDGLYTYTFKVSGYELIYDGKNSTGITYNSFVDGDVFSGFTLAQAYFDAYGSIDADIDGDGIIEHCSMGYGPTSGLFTFTFTATVNGEGKYFNIFNTEFYSLSFAKNNGNVQVCGETQESQKHYFDISVEEGTVVLTEEGTSLAYWGIHE